MKGQFPSVYLNKINVTFPEPAVPDDGVWGQRWASAGMAEQHRGQSSGEQRSTTRPFSQETGAQQTAGIMEPRVVLFGGIHCVWYSNQLVSHQKPFKSGDH